MNTKFLQCVYEIPSKIQVLLQVWTDYEHECVTRSYNISNS
jgi:hypothetical protein